MRRIDLFIPGKPATAGSKTAFRTASGRMNITHACKRFKSWSYEVKAAAAEKYKGEPIMCPVSLSIAVAIMRPKSHFGTGRNANKLKASAPHEHTQKPDLCKIIRAVEDSLTGVIWKDDSQICEYEHCHKSWAASDTPPGTRIIITLWE